MIKTASNVDVVLRSGVVQMEHVGEKLCKSKCFFVFTMALYIPVLSQLIVDKYRLPFTVKCTFHVFFHSTTTERGPASRKCTLLRYTKEEVMI